MVWTYILAKLQVPMGMVQLIMIVRNICWLIVANISLITPLADNSFRSLAATPYPAGTALPPRPAGVTPLWRSELFFLILYLYSMEHVPFLKRKKLINYYIIRMKKIYNFYFFVECNLLYILLLDTVVQKHFWIKNPMIFKKMLLIF